MKSKTLTLPYRKETIEVTVPSGVEFEVLEPNDVPSSDSASALHAALASPCGIGLEEYLGDSTDLLVIINDATRPTPTAVVLDAVHDTIAGRNIRFLVATGVHRGATTEELKTLLGTHFTRYGSRVTSHECRKKDDMVYLGTTPMGTEVSLNRMAVEAEKILVIGSVEPHYFAGYTGGRKAFLPGVASYKTIEMNHRHALSPLSRTLALEGNPVHDDIMEGLKITGKESFAVMAVLDKRHSVYAATAGGIVTSFEAAVERADEIFVAPAREKADIVVSVARYPMDIDLYQSQKALENGKLILKEGGILILVSSCRDGVGEKAFYELLRSCETPEGVLQKISSGYVLGYHKAAKMAEINTWAEVWACSDLEDEVWKDIFITPMPGVQQALDRAVTVKGKGAKIVFLTDGTVTVPRPVS